MSKTKKSVSHLYVQHSFISVYIRSGHACGRSMRLPASMKRITSGPFIFWTKWNKSSTVTWVSILFQKQFCNSVIKLIYITDFDRTLQKIMVQYLVRFPSVGKGLPHGDTKTPHVTFTGEFVEVYTFWGVPFQRPFTCSTSLYIRQ